ncbi:MAG: hypothetical protein IPK82_41080 [Polyangiaceae bacterium]|nr:hypothetical protein [Polyangiaceae bacterium]
MKYTASKLAHFLLSLAPLAAATLSTAEASADTSFTAFESGQVRPLALSPNGKLLFAVNTPDNRLEIFRVTPSGLEHQTSVTVGVEPVAVAARSNSEVWVVNHLSDSVSIVNVHGGGAFAQVERTLLVGDEPRDIVFAGSGKNKAFVTTAHRGQNSPVDPQLTTPGVGRADVWVIDAATNSTQPSTHIVTLFADTPRALAASPDGSKVYAAAFHSGNQTMTLNESMLNDNLFFQADLGGRTLPGPTTNVDGVPHPAVGLIVRYNGTHWVDENGTAWDDKVAFNLPDKDVFVIDANANPPAPLGNAYTGVGTILYNMAVNPVNGKVYVSNTEAFNEKRFEGPGVYAGHSVRGHFAENRITVLGSNGAVAPRHLNKHVNYSTCCDETPNAESVLSLALPTEMAVSPDGKMLFVAAMGSSKIGVYKTAELENDTFYPSSATQIQVSGGGPTGVVLDSKNGRLFALTRFDNSISTISLASMSEVSHVAMPNPEPPTLVAGRRFLYDATLSAHGDSSCATCHVFGDMDDLAWDLGNPDDSVTIDAGPFGPDGVGLVDPATGYPIHPLFGPISPPTHHPMKGPMTTQSLRGMANHGPMHWRADRNGGDDAPSAQPDQGAFDERAAFMKFQGGFVNLVGTAGPIPNADMEAFTDFILQVTYPPNPIRALDNSLTPDEQAGSDLFHTRHLGTGILPPPGPTCNDCHVVNPEQNIGDHATGFFGSDGRSSFDFGPQLLKVPHLRNLYQKVGMFGMAFASTFPPIDIGHKGDQIRGFGYTHDGSVDTVFRFHSLIFFAPPFSPSGFGTDPQGELEKRQLEQFMFAMDSNVPPVTAQQITLRKGNLASALPRLFLLRERAEEGECDLIAKTHLGAREWGFAYLSNGQFAPDLDALSPLPAPVLTALSQISPVTFTCVPLGSGVRAGIDRDLDGTLDGDE